MSTNPTATIPQMSPPRRWKQASPRAATPRFTNEELEQQTQRIQSNAKQLMLEALQKTPENYRSFIVAISHDKKIKNGWDDEVKVPIEVPYMSVDGRVLMAIDEHKATGKRIHISRPVIENDQVTGQMLCHITVSAPLRGRSTGTSRIVVETSGYGVNAKNPVENAITSALGRALGQLGYGCFGTGIACAEEVLDALRSDGSVNGRGTITGLTRNEGGTPTDTASRTTVHGADSPHARPATTPTSEATSGKPGEALAQIAEGFSQLFGADQDQKAAFLATITASEKTPGIRTLKNASGATLTMVRDTLQTISSVGDDLHAWVEELYGKKLHELTHTESMDLVRRITAARRALTPPAPTGPTRPAGPESSSASPVAAEIDALAAQLNLRPGELDLLRNQVPDDAALLSVLRARANGGETPPAAAGTPLPPPAPPKPPAPDAAVPVFSQINALFNQLNTPAAERAKRMKEYRGRETELVGILQASAASATEAAPGADAAGGDSNTGPAPF